MPENKTKPTRLNVRAYIDDLTDPVRRAELYPRWRWTHIPQDVLPALRQRGVSDEQIHQMLVANPQAIFERQGGY